MGEFKKWFKYFFALKNTPRRFKYPEFLFWLEVKQQELTFLSFKTKSFKMPKKVEEEDMDESDEDDEDMEDEDDDEEEEEEEKEDY